MSEIRELRRGAASWPPALEQLASVPASLWLRAAVPLDVVATPPAVGIVGARRPTAAGERFAFDLARELAAAGVAVVSGLALGIDAQAHLGALAGGGRTIAVLGSGIDRVHPRRHVRLAERVAASGALVSEWGPGVEPAPWRFPVRNRIIAGLSGVTVVIEARLRSGALITADCALAIGRDVLAVPGAPWSPTSEGTNGLLRSGAAPVTCVEDVLDALGLPPQPSRPPDASLDGLAGRVLAELRERPARAADLAVALDLPAGALSALLAELALGERIVEERDGTLVVPSRGR